MLNLSRLASLLLGVGLIIGGLEVCFTLSWSPKLAWGFLLAAGVGFVLVFLDADHYLHRSPPAA